MPALTALGWWLPSVAVPAFVCWVVTVAIASIATDSVRSSGHHTWKRNIIATVGTAGPVLLRCLVAVAVGGVAFFVVLIVLGASVRFRLPDTSGLALLLAVATLAPGVAAVQDFDKAGRHRLLCMLRQTPERAEDTVSCYAGVGAVVGAWLGAAALPLDWGVWWQVWPTPCCSGLVIGHVMGVALALARCKKEKPPERYL